MISLVSFIESISDLNLLFKSISSLILLTSFKDDLTSLKSSWSAISFKEDLNSLESFFNDLVKEDNCLINLGKKEVKTDSDGWTIRTLDGQASAHFEHTITITSDGPRILSQSVDNG